MSRFFAFLAGIFLWVSLAHATPALDGTSGWQATCNTGGTQSLALTLTTIQTQDAIIITVGTGGVSHGFIQNITDTSGLQWQRRAAGADFTLMGDINEEWYAPAPSALTADIITLHWPVPVGGGCYAAVAFGISGAQWPVPFDPLWGNQARFVDANAQQSFTTAGTDDLLLAHYITNFCTSPTPGAGWTAVVNPAGISNLIQYQTVSGAQSGYLAAVGSCSSNIQMSILDAFAAPDGLGALNESSKLNTYAILQTGMGTSKQNMYVIAEPGIGTSKQNAYAVLQNNPAPTPGAFGKGGLILHSFPP